MSSEPSHEAASSASAPSQSSGTAAPAAATTTTDYSTIIDSLIADGFADLAASLSEQVTTRFGAAALEPAPPAHLQPVFPVTAADLAAPAPASAMGDEEGNGPSEERVAEIAAHFSATPSSATAASADAAPAGAGVGVGGFASVAALASAFGGSSGTGANQITSVTQFPQHVPYSIISSSKSPLVSAAFSTDGAFLAAAAADGYITLSRMSAVADNAPTDPRGASTSTGVMMTFDALRCPLTSVHFHPVESLIVATGADGSLSFVDHSRNAPRLLHAVARDSHALSCAVSHPTGDWVLAAGNHPLPRLYNTTTLQPHVMLGGATAARKAALEAAGITVTAGAAGAGLFPTSAEVDLEALGLPTRPITAVDYSPMGDMFATASADGSVHLWDTISGTLIRRFASAHPGGAGSVTFAPSGRFLLSSGAGGSTSLWDLRSMSLSSSIPAWGKDSTSPSSSAPGAPSFGNPASFQGSSMPPNTHFPVCGSATFSSSPSHVLVVAPAGAAPYAGGGGVKVFDISAGGAAAGIVPSLHPRSRAINVTQCPGKPFFVTCGVEGRAVVVGPSPFADSML